MISLLPRVPALTLALGLLAAPLSPACAGDIVVDTSVNHAVYGNGDPRDNGNPINGLTDATGNSVTVTDRGQVSGPIDGGHDERASGASTANANAVTVGQTDVENINGGAATSGAGAATANNNSVTLNGDARGVTGGSAIVLGGSSPATASGNKITLSNGQVSPLIGGYAKNSAGDSVADGNTVTVHGGTIIVNVNGGYAESISGSVTGTNNSVTLDNGSFVNAGVGGASVISLGGGKSAIASGNVVVVSNSEVGGAVVGGGARLSDELGSIDADALAIASNNVVTIDNNIVGSNEAEGVTGGHAYSKDQGTATASDNAVTIRGSDTEVSGNVTGGLAISQYGAATVTRNRVTILDGAIEANAVAGGFADGNDSQAEATATNNSLAIHGGTVNAVQSAVAGGLAIASGNATAAGNELTIRGGTVLGLNTLGISGGVALSGGAGDAVSTGNSITISGGKAFGDISGGYADGVNASATGNSVTISGGELQNSIYGGLANGSNYAATTATGNTVTISGRPTFSAATRLYGGYTETVLDTDDEGTQDVFTGNTLNVWNYRGNAVRSAENFQFLNFRIPANQRGPVLAVTDTAVLGNGAGKGSTVTSIDTLSGTSPMRPGSNVTLIQAGTLDAKGFTQSRTQGKHGALLKYTWDLSTTNTPNALTARVANVRTTPGAKALSEGFISGLALVNQGADLVAGKGMSEAVNAAESASGGSGFGGFGALSGGWSRYNTGSHVDMSSLSLIAGLSWGVDLQPGRLVLGAFFEWGNGSYDTYNAFSNTSVNGDGAAYHVGGGILGRMDFVNTGPGHIYTEGSFRAGSGHNEYNSSDLRDAAGRNADYDSDSAYYGLHLGTGYIWDINESTFLDLYGKYFWTRQGSDSVTLPTDEKVKFKDADSSRLRGGARLVHAVNEYVSPYVGAAYEYEFDGKARATTYGYDIDAPTLRGGTGIGELGVSLKPSKDLPLSFDLGVQGYVGKREGVTGSLRVMFTF